MNFFQRRNILKKANYLELTPVKTVPDEIDDQKIVTVLIPKVTSRLGKKYFEPMLKSKFIKLKLDELGSAAWISIDGNKKVSVIASELVNLFGEKINSAEERLTKYLTVLYEQRLITFQEIKGEK